MKAVKEVLRKVAIQLQSEGVVWGLGGSCMLSAYDLAEHPNDIDIMVAERDADRTHRVLSVLGESRVLPAKPSYCTKQFRQYIIDGMQVETMAAFGIHHTEGNYLLDIQRENITGSLDVQGVPVPLTSLEDWYVIYMLMAGRIEKAECIERYWSEHGIAVPHLLQAAARKPLPEQILARLRLAIDKDERLANVFRDQTR